MSFGNVGWEHGKEERRGTSDDIVDKDFFSIVGELVYI